jgi:hypothetical protein
MTAIVETAVLETKKVCYGCGSDKTYAQKHTNGRLQYHWYANPPIGWLCEKCNNTYVKNPKWHPITNRRRIWYGGRQVYVEEEHKIGVCNWCRAVAPFDCKYTGRHHELYDNKDPMKHTIEICFACHRTTFKKRGKNKKKKKLTQG